MIILEDFFVDNRNEWPEKQSPDVALGFEGGYLFEHKRTSGSWRVWAPLNIDWSRDFSIRCAIEKISGTDDFGYGLIWDLKDSENLHCFLVTGSGFFRVDRCVAGQWGEIQPWIEHQAVRQGNANNWLTIERKGNELSFYVNDELVLQKPFSQFQPTLGKSVGFYVVNQIKTKIKSLVVSQSENQKIVQTDPVISLENDDLDSVFADMNKLVGLPNIKQEMNTLVNFLRVQQEREKRGLLQVPLSLHMVFTGPPGTGKTTVARLIGRIYKQLGFLKSGHVIETDRAGLVAGYVGQTAIKVDDLVKKAIGGILFIDEAYALEPEDTHHADFGQEAIDTLMKRMEDHRDQLAVIIAGYHDEMDRFINANPGVRSRFNRYFYFDHYQPTELLAIFDNFAKSSGYSLTSEAQNELSAIFTAAHACRDKTFGNARFARNLFEEILGFQSNRIAKILSSITDEAMQIITDEDIPDMETEYMLINAKKALN